MNDFQKFIRVGDDRINAEEIVSYGIHVDEDDDKYLYIETKTSEDIFQYYEDDVDFELEEKIGELDGLLLIRTLGYVNFNKK